MASKQQKAEDAKAAAKAAVANAKAKRTAELDAPVDDNVKSELRTQLEPKLQNGDPLLSEDEQKATEAAINESNPTEQNAEIQAKAEADRLTRSESEADVKASDAKNVDGEIKDGEGETLSNPSEQAEGYSLEQADAADAESDEDSTGGTDTVAELGAGDVTVEQVRDAAAKMIAGTTGLDMQVLANLSADDAARVMYAQNLELRKEVSRLEIQVEILEGVVDKYIDKGAVGKSVAAGTYAGSIDDLGKVEDLKG